jgi:hypothetical protein
VAESLKKSGKTFRRVLGSDNIYTLKQRMDNGEWDETEVILLNYFIEKINDLSSLKLQEDEKELLTRVFQVKSFPNLIPLE